MNKYKAVGVLENFNSTLHLFNRALSLPNYDWLEEFDRGERRTIHGRIYRRWVNLTRLGAMGQFLPASRV